MGALPAHDDIERQAAVNERFTLEGFDDRGKPVYRKRASIASLDEMDEPKPEIVAPPKKKKRGAIAETEAPHSVTPPRT